jgi:putative CocE/NonD family hydrolase
MTFAFDLLLDQRVPLRSGQWLSATLYLPRGTAARPALVTFTPYGADFAHSWASRNVAWGYPVAVFDVLGRGESSGVHDMFGPHEVEACLEALQWVRAQSWCTGRFGLYGGSYAGILQWLIACRAPEGLGAIAPTVAPMPGFDDGTGDGVPWIYALRWGAYVHGKSTRHNLFADDVFWRTFMHEHWQRGDSYAGLANRLGVPIQTFVDAVAQFDHIRPAITEHPLAAIACPVLTVTGTSDDSHRGAIAWHEAFLKSGAICADQSRLLIGPWLHSGNRALPKAPDEPAAPDPVFDEDPIRWSDEVTLAWFDHHLLGQSLNKTLASPATIFVEGRETWQHGDTISALSSASLTLYPNRDFGLMAAPDAIHVSPFKYHPWDDTLVTCEASGACAPLWRSLIGSAPEDTGFGDALVSRDGSANGLAFWSDPCPSAINLIGRPKVSLSISADYPKFDLCAAILAHLPDGRRLTLSGVIKRVNLGPDLVPDAFHQVILDHTGLIARVLPEGTKLGLIVRSVNSISYQRCSDTAATTRVSSEQGPVTIRLGMGGVHQTFASLPSGDL